MLAVAVDVLATVEGSSLLVGVAILKIALCCNREVCYRTVRRNFCHRQHEITSKALRANYGLDDGQHRRKPSSDLVILGLNRIFLPKHRL